MFLSFPGSFGRCLDAQERSVKLFLKSVAFTCHSQFVQTLEQMLL